MHALTFDTHFYIKKLQTKGFSEQQAESVVEMVKETNENNSSALATKKDLSDLRLELKAEISELKAELIKWVVGIGFAQVAMILTVMKLH